VHSTVVSFEAESDHIDGGMLVMVLVGPGAVRVEQVVVHKHLNRPSKSYLRVKRGTYLVADCATVDEVASLVDLATLEEVRTQRLPEQPSHRPRRRS
jgi:hypothetical protein